MDFFGLKNVEIFCVFECENFLKQTFAFLNVGIFVIQSNLEIVEFSIYVMKSIFGPCKHKSSFLLSK
jgi:hypothetical protein